ncbi:amidase [Streptomyces sp. H27-C3]|uniref:amidase n=1 Tax=Streptomyces sp. H27-C3 TaxID=3046305 RepID=UPI0024BA0DFE|nr:amidase [Streptomyces sp. H27-C3]MDJ0460830.1 amidase [Streptomyces sp. H27-C3]
MDPLVRDAATLTDRIAQLDEDVRAFVPEPDRPRRIAADARRIAERWPDSAERPPLYGVPVGIKDIVRVDGLPTRAGSELPADALAGRQATVVDRLRRAGALVAGKTVTAEFAVLAPGPTRNPRDLAHTPGGSSSGSAAAVAAGMVPLAVGTQTVGSMIRPAAYCGVTGFKPTYGRIPVDGVIASAPSFDTLGLYARDVAGLATAAAVVCDDWQSAALGSGSPGPVLGIPVGPYLERAGAEALDAFDAQVKQVRAAGFDVRPVPMMDDFEQIVAQLFVMNRYEVARTHAEWFTAYGELYRPETVKAIREGHDIGDDAYARARQEREEFRERIAAAKDAHGIDLWITPAATGPAPRGLDSTGSSLMCLPWSNAGLPSLSLPAGATPQGLPFGLQCVAAWGADEQLLSWAPGIVTALAGPGPVGP